MKRLLFPFLLMLVCAVCTQGQFSDRNARRLFSSAGAPGVGNPATPSCTPGPPFTDYYTNTTDRSVWQCTSAPNNWTKVVSGGAPAPTSATYITQTPDATLSAEQALSLLATGILKNTTTTGVLSIAVAGDFPTLNQNTTGAAANLSGTPALPNGTTATTQSQADGSTKIATDAYVDTGLATKQASGSYLTVANNLSDLNNAGTARTNLSLGTSATVNTGTSGATIPLLNGNNTTSGSTTFGKAAIMPNNSLTDNGSTIATDASLGNNFRVTALTANVTLSNPTNSTDGQVVTWEVIQNASAAKTLAFGTNFAFGAEITGCTISATLSSHNFITAIYNSTMTKWLVRGCLTGY